MLVRCGGSAAALTAMDFQIITIQILLFVLWNNEMRVQWWMTWILSMIFGIFSLMNISQWVVIELTTLLSIAVEIIFHVDDARFSLLLHVIWTRSDVSFVFLWSYLTVRIVFLFLFLQLIRFDIVSPRKRRIKSVSKKSLENSYYQQGKAPAQWCDFYCEGEYSWKYIFSICILQVTWHYSL